MAREEGPFEYFSEKADAPGVTANSIRNNLTHPDKNNAAIIALAGELEDDTTNAANNVDGAIDGAIRQLPAGAKATATNLGANGAYALGLMREFAENVETFDEKTSDCNWQYRTQLASAMRWAGQAAAQTKDEKDDKKVDEAHLGPGIESYIRQNEYKPAWQKLDGQMDTLKSDFNKGPSNEKVRDLIKKGLLPLEAATLYPGLKLTEADKKSYYKNVLGTMSPEEQKEWIKANLKHLDPAVAHVVDPEVQKYFADEVAKDIKDPENIDDDTIALMNMFKGEEAFADRLYTTVTPKEMGDAIIYLNNTFNPQEPSNFSDEDPNKLLARYDGFLNAAGVALATHSNSPSTDPNELADTWFNAITDDKNKAQGVALTLLMREGGEQPDGKFDPTFIDRVADRVLTWEQSQDGRVWGPRTEGQFLADPDKVKFLNVQHDDTGYWYMTPSNMSGEDGMANLLGAMGHSPEGAQRFFMTSDGHVDQDRLQYLMVDRTFSGIHGSDEGDGLGEALEAATVGGTNGSDGDWNRNEGADLASKAFQLVAKNSGTGDGFGPDGKWHMWPEMADSMGMIASGFSSDVYDIIDGSPKSTTDDPLPGHLTISASDFDKVLGEIGRGDKSGIEGLSAAIMIEGNNRFNDAIADWKSDHPGQPITMEALADSGLGLALQGRGETNGEILGHILNKSVLVDLDDAEIEKTRAEYVSKAIDVASGFLPGASSVLGEGAKEVTKNLYDTATGEGIDLLKKGLEASEGNDYRQASRGSVETSLEYNLINQLVRNGYLGEQSPGDTTANPGVPESLLVDGPNGTKVINPGLYDVDGVDKIGKDGQYTPEQLAQMRKDWNEWRNTNNYNLANGVVSQAADGFDREVNKGP